MLEYFRMSSPCHQTFPAFAFCKPNIARLKLVLPQPDSPTSPKVSPLKSLKLTPLTAMNDSMVLPKIFFFISKATSKSFICKIGEDMYIFSCMAFRSSVVINRVLVSSSLFNKLEIVGRRKGLLPTGGRQANKAFVY